MEAVLKEAANWGLLTPHVIPIFLRLQPIFPYFLRTRLNDAGDDLRGAVETGFREFYDGVGDALGDLLDSKDAQEKQMGQVLTRLEYENLMNALKLALNVQTSFSNIYDTLFFYLNAKQDNQRSLELAQKVLAHLDNYPADTLKGQLGIEFVTVIDRFANSQLNLKQYVSAESSYQKALSIWLKNESYEASQIKKMSATFYHQLGYVAQEQRQWEQAEKYYNRALEIKIEFNDRYSQAGTYGQLGIVAQKQRQWEQAEKYYNRALEIFIEFNDRYSQAKTYHALGALVQEQKQWEQARAYALTALEIYAEYGDKHNLGIVLRALARIWKESNDDTLPAAIAKVLGISAADAEELLKNPLASMVESDPEVAKMLENVSGEEAEELMKGFSEIAALLEALPEEAREELMKLASVLQNAPPEEAEKLLKELFED
jgi:tetratricopeptide (TPR) repeat protein